MFISGLGYDPILSENGQIAYDAGIALDESCYREVESADMFVLIIGGRYGSEISETKAAVSPAPNQHYVSVTRKEFETAIEKDVPVYILVESGVLNEYKTFLRNRENQQVNYAHVDSPQVFLFLDEIHGKRRNNPVHSFERFFDIENWLREQWAGMFRELLSRRVRQQELRSLAKQVEDLKEVNRTLQTYMEELLKSGKGHDRGKIIERENQRLKNRRHDVAANNPLFRFLNDRSTVPIEEILDVAAAASSPTNFTTRLIKILPPSLGSEKISDLKRKLKLWSKDPSFLRDLDFGRRELGLHPFAAESRDEDEESNLSQEDIEPELLDDESSTDH